MFTLYRIGFCSVSKVAQVQCEQELMFCCGAEIVPKHSQCEQKPYPLMQFATLPFDLKRSLTKNEVPLQFLLRQKCSDLIRTVSKTYPIRNVPLSTAERSSTVPEQKLFESSIPSVNRSASPIRYTFCDAPFHYPVQCEHSDSLFPNVICISSFHFSNLREIVSRLHRATLLRLVALNKSLTMIMTSFLCVINII